MKKTLLILLLTSTVSAFSQNVQLHYDMLKDRNYLTTTVEMFKPDKWGNTFFFVDMNYGVKDWNNKEATGVNLAYWEIARVIKPTSLPIGFHAEFNGGLGRTNTGIGYGINEAWLAGVDYSWNDKTFSKGFSLKALYKYIARKHNDSFQLTGVWYAHFVNRSITFNGFADFWRENSDFNFDGKTDAKFVFLSEAQLWYNFDKHFSAGGEIEFANDFVVEGFHVHPTVAVKYSF